ncbi:GTP cyclohydrolase I FolE2 [Halomonas eurihalina]|uniref:GTP cyclohydrolase FolE2 n=1 Tax=Halomonas eurihalina TaxID=42566 RepID=A0A5D9DFF9_HALER|nr:GTP cyclohydrolase FolE2 [Halomonas eurihalina]MDR5858088.1 GTP cyclohydrolase FolE2 [Halomonas eurihalina]TZG41405.1 GTP cyclohydrolase I FolE2 [Halomonas eurihalina]
MMSEALEDVAAGRTATHGALNWVGMDGISLPVRVVDHPVDARVAASVSLDDPAARGIHMSRLYLLLEELAERELEVPRIAGLLENFLASHTGLSRRARLFLTGELTLRRPALVSPLAGWKGYPVALRSWREGNSVETQLELKVGYSSTCPCSAALARQLIQQQFDRDFGDESLDHASIRDWLGESHGILATPHSQRSEARITVRLADGVDTPPWLDLIERVEAVLGTALQTAVKRVDEQAFALANGQNTMFCEDAARRLHQALSDVSGIAGFHVRVVHAESLHAHDAVAESQADWWWRD